MIKRHWSYRYGMRQDGSSRWLIGHWYWWRHNHYMSFPSAVWMTFKASVVWPLNSVRYWILLRTIQRWKVRRLRKIIRELEKDLSDDK